MKFGKQTRGALSYAQKVGLAMAFIGEHKKEFEDWLRSKGMKTEVKEEND